MFLLSQDYQFWVGCNKTQRKAIKLMLTNLPILLSFLLVLDTMCITLDSQTQVSATPKEEKLEHRQYQLCKDMIIGQLGDKLKTDQI